MKKLVYLLFSVAIYYSCSPGEREAKDITNPEEQNISPNQTDTEEERQRRDSTATDPIISDSAKTRDP